MALERGKVYVGDARDLAGQLAPQSVSAIVTSPPYWKLRSYLAADHPDKATEMGSEATPAEYVANLVRLFRLLWPALRDDGVLWLNIGDAYNSGTSGSLEGSTLTGGQANQAQSNRNGRGLVNGYPPKCLMGLPWRVAFALIDDGWILRSDVIWSKPNPMPESVRDRPTRSHEYLFLLSKGPRYFYDAEAIREPQSEGTFLRFGNGKAPRKTNPKSREASVGEVLANSSFKDATPDAILPDGRNKRDVWTIPSAQFPDSHFATFPPDLVRPCIRAGSSERGVCAACGAPWVRVVEREAGVPASYNGSTFTNGKTGAVHDTRGQGPRYTTKATDEWQPTCTCDAGVRPALILDPFLGSGTTAQVAVEEGRDWIGFDLDERAVGWTAQRLARLPVRSLFAASPLSAD